MADYNAVANPTGAVEIGEIEDYALTIHTAYSNNVDWGDAPYDGGTYKYPTLSAQNGANHALIDGFCLGNFADAETNGQVFLLWGMEDDFTDGWGGVAEFNDEDALDLTMGMPTLFQGRTATVAVYVTTPSTPTAYLNLWVDFNANGLWDFGTFNEQPISDLVVTSGWNVISFTVPPTATLGQTFARFRLCRSTGLTMGGHTSSGEVEDYQLYIQSAPATSGTDYGDAPTNYLAVAGPNAGCHTLATGYFLGECVDPESQAQAGSNATGDDYNGHNDEKGIFFPELVLGKTAFLDVFCGPLGGKLDGWIDVDNDNEWEISEHIFGGVSHTLTAGWNFNIKIKIPDPGIAGYHYARVRLSPSGTLSPYGTISGGEVEDYEVMTYQPAPLEKPIITDIAPGASTTTVSWSGYSNGTYRVRTAPVIFGPWTKNAQRYSGNTNHAAVISTSSSITQKFFKITMPDTE